MATEDMPLPERPSTGRNIAPMKRPVDEDGRKTIDQSSRTVLSSAKSIGGVNLVSEVSFLRCQPRYLIRDSGITGLVANTPRVAVKFIVNENDSADRTQLSASLDTKWHMRSERKEKPYRWQQNGSLGSNPKEARDVRKGTVPSRHGGTLNSRRATNPLVRLMEGKETWEALDYPQGVQPQNWRGNEPKRTDTCMVLKATTNNRSTI
ncbi:uncharacterized protein TNCV_2978841 [Trichonephila clavipes]|nr:uncharacterized protein TNCV_2978841 [Trichonephila clavipes]